VVEGGGAVGAGEPAHGDEGAGAPVHLAGVTATLLWPPPLSLTLFPAASLPPGLYARGFMAACSRSSNHGRGGEIRQGGRADPEKAGESG